VSGTILLDGVPCTDGRGALRMDDPALWTGMAVFETLRTRQGLPFRVEVHLARLRESAAWCGVPFHEGLQAELAQVAEALVTGPGGPREAKLNVLLTEGGHRIVKAEALDLSRAGAPVRVVTRAWAPDPWLPGHVKHVSRAGWVLAARRAGVDEVLWSAPSANLGHLPAHRRKGERVWTEANRSNVIVVRDGVLLTPPDDGRILQGVTRDGMLAAARRAGLPMREEEVPVGPCEEMYLCSTLKELAPIVELDGEPGPGGGPLGAALHAAFRAEWDP